MVYNGPTSAVQALLPFLNPATGPAVYSPAAVAALTGVGGTNANKGTMFTPGGGITPYDGTTFNFAPYQYLQTEGQRYAFGGTAHYQITPGIDFY